MVRRFVGGKIFDVLHDGTTVEIPQVVPPRSLPIMMLKDAVNVGDVVGEFIHNFLGVSVALPGIVIPPPEVPSPPDVVFMPVETPSNVEPVADAGPPPTAPSLPEGGPGFGVITTEFGEPPHDVEQAIIGNWPQHLWRDAARISYRESGWSNGATNDTRWRAGGSCNVRYFIPSLGIWAWTEFSIGIFQINLCSSGGAEGELRNPSTNAAKAHSLYASSGDWSPWAYSARALGLPQRVL